MAPRVQIVGSLLSPYVRKVLVCLQLKGIDYEIDPIVAFLGDDRFSQLSPLRRIPVLIDDRVTLCDSSVICQYLEDRYPAPRLYPEDIALCARARWLEEFADTRMGDVFIWRIFHQLAIRPFVFGDATDRAIVDAALATDLPDVLAYLERELPEDGFACGELSIADISIAAFFRNLAFVKVSPDAARFPKTVAYVARVLAEAPFQRLMPLEKAMMRAKPSEHRQVLLALGVSLMADTDGAERPRAGLRPI